MNQEQHEENQIIEKLEAQKNAVQPSQQLLRTIIAQLPAQEQPQQSFTLNWVRFALPIAGAAVLLAGIFFVSELSQTPSGTPTPSPVAVSESSPISPPQAIAPVTTEKALSLASLNTEEQQLENELAFDDFFEDELQMQEIDAALATF